jgi:calcineurin-like phosphoesterase family protein
VSGWRDDNGKVPLKKTRDFKNLDEMNDTIVNNINKVVKQDDILIFLGDFSFSGFDQIRKFRDRIVCKTIHFITGNHDHHVDNNRENIQEIFTSVSEFTLLKYGTLVFILFHRPIRSWDNMKKGVMHLYGHLHSSPEKRFGIGRSMDVGIDSNPEFRPYNIKEIISLLEVRSIKSEIIDDHHI